MANADLGSNVKAMKRPLLLVLAASLGTCLQRAIDGACCCCCLMTVDIAAAENPVEFMQLHQHGVTIAAGRPCIACRTCGADLHRAH